MQTAKASTTEVTDTKAKDNTSPVNLSSRNSPRPLRYDEVCDVDFGETATDQIVGMYRMEYVREDEPPAHDDSSESKRDVAKVTLWFKMKGYGYF